MLVVGRFYVFWLHGELSLVMDAYNRYVMSFVCTTKQLHNAHLNFQ